MNINKNKYYTLKEIARILGTTTEKVKTYSKRGELKLIYKDDNLCMKGNDLILYKEFYDFAEGDIYKNKVKELSKRDKIRQALVYIWIIVIAPLISFVIYRKIVGDEFMTTEVGQLILILIVLISAVIAGLSYEYIFPKYKKDIPK